MEPAMKIVSLAVATALICAGAQRVGIAQALAPHPANVSQATPSDTLSLAQDRANFRLMMTSAVRRNIVSAAEAMPADKYGFAPTVGEFQNVRTFGHQIRHLAATNFILAAAALGQDPPADAGDEEGPDTVVTKAQHIAFLNRSFDALEKAIDAIGNSRIGVRSSPISPFQGNTATRISLVSEALTHAYDHYGQMVVYLRMNGVIPPASRR
jgi:uncharacterized damage-inducible protein DinB